MQTENLYTPNSVRTLSGKYVNMLEIDPDTIDIEDIAHALARECRFGNHLREHFSVAQHSVMCADGVLSGFKFDALMHDASEYLLHDLPKPIKQLMPDYKMVEDRLMHAIADKFGFRWPMHDLVARYDRLQLEREWTDLMLGETFMDYDRIVPWSEDRARKTFLGYFNLLKP